MSALTSPDVAEYTATSPEALKGKPQLLVIYGHHGINEEIAQRVAVRLGRSAVKLKTDLTMFRQPTGLDYVDAYEEAKKQADPQSAEFALIYRKEVQKRLEAGYEAGYELAKKNPGTAVVDIHASPGGIDSLPPEGLLIATGLDKNQAVLLKQSLTPVVPLGFPIEVSLQKELTPIDNRQQIRVAPNYLTIEILSDYSLYVNLAEIENPRVDSWTYQGELHRLKVPQNNPSTKGRYALLGRIDSEVTKYSRILEGVLPQIAKLYQQQHPAQSL